jgi:hypothetical protein
MADDSIDLMKPGKLWAKAQNEKDVTFHLVLPKDKYTKANLTKNPQIDPADELMTPFTIGFAGADQDGVCTCDLAQTGRAQSAMDKIEDMVVNGQDTPTQVRGVFIATARAGNSVPDSQVAEVKDFKLVPIPSITLKGMGAPVDPKPYTDGTYITVKQFKAGKKFFQVSLTVKGIPQVQLTTTPGLQIQIDGGPQGNGSVAMAVKDGQTYTVNVATQHVMSNGTQTRQGRQTYPVYAVWDRGGWRVGGIVNGEYDAARGGYKCAGETDSNQVRRPNGGGMRNTWFNNDGRPAYFDGNGIAQEFYTEVQKVWTGGTAVLRVAGTGNFTHFVRSINLESAAFASDAEWADGPPPPVLGHNCC